MGQTSLQRATHCGHEHIICFLIKHGADADCQNDDGRTPWSANVRGNNVSVLMLLLDAGADPSTRDYREVSELYRTARQRSSSSYLTAALTLAYERNLAGLLCTRLRGCELRSNRLGEVTCAS